MSRHMQCNDQKLPCTHIRKDQGDTLLLLVALERVIGVCDEVEGAVGEVGGSLLEEALAESHRLDEGRLLDLGVEWSVL